MLASRQCTHTGAATRASSSAPAAFSCSRTQGGPRRRRLTTARSSESGPGPALNEDVLARLRAAEEEAAKLRKQLAEVQGDKVPEPQDVIETPAKRIDGGDLRRETLFTLETERRNWLSEADVEFFTGSAPPGEAAGGAGSGPTEEEQAIVRRNLLIGVGLTVVTAAFALVPTDALKPAPSKPLFFYLTPLVRIQGLLEECEPVISDGEWPRLQALLGAIRGAPNNARQNLYDAASLLPEERQKVAAQKLALQVIEYLTDMDYNTFFDALPGTKVVPPQQQAKFVAFSSNARQAAQRTLAEYLALMPEDQLEAARLQAGRTAF